jgi:hypothetical protein
LPYRELDGTLSLGFLGVLNGLFTDVVVQCASEYGSTEPQYFEVGPRDSALREIAAPSTVTGLAVISTNADIRLESYEE